MNNVSDRAAQSKDGQWSRAKSYDTFGPCGPRFVPATEIPDSQRLDISCDLNGQRMQDSNTANMISVCGSSSSSSVPGSRWRTGDVISTERRTGSALSVPEPVFLKPGDVMTVTIEGIGSLTNPVVGAGD